MFSSLQMKHFITTPFCVRRPFKGQVKPQLPSQEWLDHRLKLFENFCLPSVVAQSDQNFEWLIYFDEQISVEYLDRVRSLIAEYKNFSVKLCAIWDSEVIAKDIVESLSNDTRWVITSRLDNDDGLHKDFVANLHDSVEEREEFLNFPFGIILYSDKCYLYRHLSNAFLSFVAPVEKLRTVWCTAHEQASSISPVRQLTDVPAFLQVVHGKNVSNKPRGTRINSRQAAIGFEAILQLNQSGKNETSLGVSFENATTVIMWKFRDFLILIAKKLLR